MRVNGLFILLLIFITSIAVYASVPPVINYQGKLMQSDNTSVADGEYSIQFAIYDLPTSGTALWSEVNQKVQVKSGLFSVLLGSINNLPMNIFDSPNRFFGVKVGTDPEMTPRQQIASVAFAIKANEADLAKTVPDGTITTSKITDNAVTAEKLAASSVNESHVADAAISTLKLADAVVIASKLAEGAINSTNTHLQTGEVIATSSISINDDVFTDIPGAITQLTVSVPSTLLAFSSFDIDAFGVTSGVWIGDINVDGSRIGKRQVIYGGGQRASISQIWSIPLEPGQHTIKLQGARPIGTGSAWYSSQCGFSYIVFAR